MIADADLMGRELHYAGRGVGYKYTTFRHTLYTFIISIY